MGMSDAQPRPVYEAQVSGRRLLVTVHRDGDVASLRHDWAHALKTLHPGPFAEVRIDLGRTGLLTSTFLAGLLQLQQHYQADGAAPLILDRPDPRVVRMLGMMHLDRLFTIVARA